MGNAKQQTTNDKLIARKGKGKVKLAKSAHILILNGLSAIYNFQI